MIEVWREAWRDARMQVVPTLLLLIVAIGATAGALLTAGQQMAQQRLLSEELESPSARLVTVRENTGALTPAVLTLLRATDGVEAAFGTGELFEVDTSVPGVTLTAWEVTDTTVAYATELGRTPAGDEAIIDTALLARMGWDAPSGSLETSQGRQVAVVSGGRARPGYESFAETALVRVDELASYRTIVVMAEELPDVTDVQRVVRAYLGPDHDGELVFENSGLTIVDEMTRGDYAGFARTILLTVVALGSFLTAIVSLTYVLLYRRVLGRRRALGISRIDLATLTLARISLPIIAGSVLGGIVADVVSRTAYSPVPPTFTAAVVVLMVLAPCLVAILPILWAVNRDPVAILRTA